MLMSPNKGETKKLSMIDEQPNDNLIEYMHHSESILFLIQIEDFLLDLLVNIFRKVLLRYFLLHRYAWFMKP